MVKLLAILSGLLHLVQSLCDRGCLKCSPQNDCIFCDFTSGYYMSANRTCADSNAENCLLFDTIGDCTQCASKYFLDLSVRKCVEVPSSKAVTNCELYDSAQMCLKCSTFFYINGGNCVPVQVPIANCTEYLSATKCSKCDSGFTLNSQQTQCTSTSDSQNCAALSQLNCLACAAGYIQNNNLYLKSWNQTTDSINSALKSWRNNLPDKVDGQSICERLEVENCKISVSASECQICNKGFFLNQTKKCQKIPDSEIPGCRVYSSLSECKTCKQGYYKIDPSTCKFIDSFEAITNCTEYDPGLSLVKCTRCSEEFILSENSCQSKRVDSLNITNCNRTSADSDACQSCNVNWTLTDDGKKCLPQIDDCAEYELSDFTSLDLTCKKCHPRHHLEILDGKTSCTTGDIIGCIVYESLESCILCDSSSYFLQEGKCILHSKINHCVIYSDINSNECVTCVSGFFAFKLNQVCKAYPAVQNCIEYKGPGECGVCADQYFLENNKCLHPQSLENCKVANSEKPECLQCDTGFAMQTQNNTCAKVPDYVSQNCVVLSETSKYGDLATPIQMCNICKENSIPMDIGGSFVCYSDDLLGARGINSSLIVEGCSKYSNDMNPKCLKCSGSQKLRVPLVGSFSCVDQCDLNTETYIPDTLDGYVNACFSMQDPRYGLRDCSQAIFTFSNIANAVPTLKCIAFTSKYARVIRNINPSNNPTYWMDIENSDNRRPKYASLFYGFEIEAELIDSRFRFSSINSVNLTANCETYAQLSQYYICYRCQWGYTVKLSYSNSVPMTTCELIQGCDSTVHFGGFSAKLNAILTCHSCSVGKSLVLRMDGIADNTFTMTGFLNDTIALQCQDLQNLVTEAIPGIDSIENCLVYAVLGGKIGGCVACEPGYRPNTDDDSVIFSWCFKMEECDATKPTVLVNRCTYCSQLYNGMPALGAFSNTELQGCVSVATSNCLLAGTTVVDGINNCDTCMPGYWLNHDGMCEKLAYSNCEDELVTFFQDSLDTKVSLTKYYLLKNYASENQTSISGCNQCQANYTAFRVPADEIQCVPSFYLPSANRTDNIYIPFCTQYENTLVKTTQAVSFVCSKCENLKTKQKNGLKCVDKIDSCLMAENEPDNAKCFLCNDGYVQMSGACVKNNITNCEIFENPTTANYQICLTCQNGYVLSLDGSTCFLGDVAFCKFYEQGDSKNCKECLIGYGRVQTFENRTICFKISDDSQCKMTDNSQEGLQSAVFSCTLCMSNSTQAFWPETVSKIKDVTFPLQTICLAYNIVDNCQSYGTQNSIISQNSFLCVQCTDAYYLTAAKTCVSRVNNPEFCLEYYPEDDKCLQCDVNFSFKSADETNCIRLPKGLFACEDYLGDEYTCTKCKPGYFLNKNTCTQSSFVPNCYRYSANQTCSDCSPGYYLNGNGVCELAVAQDCYTYLSIDKCASCDPENSNRGLRTDSNGVVNCVDKNLTWCSTSTNEYPFKCLKCEMDYFPNSDGQCEIASPISHCLVWESNTTCAQCLQGYVRSMNKTSCDSLDFAMPLTKSCSSLELRMTPICVKCKPGYLFINSECISCKNSTDNKGCFQCDSSSLTACPICQPGFYQNTTGFCIQAEIQESTSAINSRENRVRLLSISVFALIVIVLI